MRIIIIINYESYQYFDQHENIFFQEYAFEIVIYH